jgi:hypothetical protein
MFLRLDWRKEAERRGAWAWILKTEVRKKHLKSPANPVKPFGTIPAQQSRLPKLPNVLNLRGFLYHLVEKQ